MAVIVAVTVLAVSVSALALAVLLPLAFPAVVSMEDKQPQPPPASLIRLEKQKEESMDSNERRATGEEEGAQLLCTAVALYDFLAADEQQVRPDGSRLPASAPR